MLTPGDTEPAGSLQSLADYGSSADTAARAEGNVSLHEDEGLGQSHHRTDELLDDDEGNTTEQQQLPEAADEVVVVVRAERKSPGREAPAAVEAEEAREETETKTERVSTDRENFWMKMLRK